MSRERLPTVVWQIEGSKVQSELPLSSGPVCLFLGLFPRLENGTLMYRPLSMAANVAEVMVVAH